MSCLPPAPTNVCLRPAPTVSNRLQPVYDLFKKTLWVNHMPVRDPILGGAGSRQFETVRAGSRQFETVRDSSRQFDTVRAFILK